MQKQLKEITPSKDESLFDVYFREVKEKVTGNGCKDILMPLIVFEQASTFYIARCIKSKYPTVLFSDGKDSKFSGLWENDKTLLQEDEITPQIGGDDDVEKTKGVQEGGVEDIHEHYKKNSMVYQLILEQMSVNKDILGFQPDITNLDAMFNFGQIGKIVDDFNTSDADQKRLSKYFDESVQLNHTMDVEMLNQFMKKAEGYFKQKNQREDDEHKKIIDTIIKKKKHKNFLVNEFNNKGLKIKHSILYAANDDDDNKLFEDMLART